MMEPKHRQAVIALCVYVLITFALLMSPVSRLLVYGFPALSMIIAVYLATRSLRLYMFFLVLLWIVAPLVRRIVDFKAGWIPATLILLAPHLATAGPLLFLRSIRSKTLNRHLLPLGIILVTSLYGAVVGLINYRNAGVGQDLALWLLPITVVPFLVINRDHISELLEGLDLASIVGLTIMGLYAIYQFFDIPLWDVLWMTKEHIESIGPPVPYKVRVFSTMNSPQVLASYLSAGILFALTSRNKFRFAAIPLGVVALMLSMARSGWLALVIGVGYLFFFLSYRQRMTLLVLVAVSLLASVIALQNPEISKPLTTRFETLNNIGQDSSFMDRTEGYQAFFESLGDHPYGLGVGASVAQQKDPSSGLRRDGKTVYMDDSTVAWVLASLGLIGGSIFAASFLLLLFRAYRGRLSRRVRFQPVRAALLGLLAESLLMSILVGPTGFLTWLCIGLLLAHDASAVDKREKDLVAARYLLSPSIEAA